jgi:predicted ribosome quality control (RQC) complex YloA/Tae2 family protein
MYVDYLNLAAIRHELASELAGARVQGIVQPSPMSIVLEMYTGKRLYLLLSAEPNEPAVAVVEKPLRRGVQQPSPLLLLLRKHVRGARLAAIEQPNLERILRLSFARADHQVYLVAELMGRLSNLILVDGSGRILDALKRIPSAVNRYRTILPQQPYVPPPPQSKQHPDAMTPQMLLEASSEAADLAPERLLVQDVAGMSPVLAREIVHRAGVVPGQPLTVAGARALIAAMDELYGMVESGDWKPSVAYKGEGDEVRVELAAPYALTHREDWERCGTMLDAVRRVLECRGALDPYARVRARLHKAIADARERLKRRWARLDESLPDEQEDALLLASGNAILALQYTIEPGQEALVVPADVAEGLTEEAPSTGLKVPLDAASSPAENAQRYFRRHQKLKAARRRIPPLIRKVRMGLAFLDQADADVEMATSRPELDEVAEALQEAGHLPERTRRHASRPSEPLRLDAPDGGLVLIGRNSRQNALVTFRLGRPEDIWLHAHGIAGAHVIYRPGGLEADRSALETAAGLAAYHSAAQEQPRVQVDFTECKHVRPIRGAGPGMVTYRHEQTIVVEPMAPSEVGGV